jgi:predicted alpha/beta-hydrolase family hydrolase
MANIIFDGPANARVTFLFAHGAGAPMDSDWMNAMAERIAGRNIRVVRFEFAYMAARRSGDGKRPPPSPANRLIAEYLDVIGSLQNRGRLFIGGKSMGGRMASMIAQMLYEKNEIAGLICLGYPFHPPGNPAKLRTDHLEKMTVPSLVCQGERDPFGTRDEVAAYPLPKAMRLFWLPDGDHDLKPRKASGLTLDQNLEAAATEIATFTKAHA